MKPDVREEYRDIMAAFAPSKIAMMLNIKEWEINWTEREGWTYLVLVADCAYTQNCFVTAAFENVAVLKLHDTDEFDIANFKELARFLGTLKP